MNLGQPALRLADFYRTDRTIPSVHLFLYASRVFSPSGLGKSFMLLILAPGGGFCRFKHFSNAVTVAAIILRDECRKPRDGGAILLVLLYFFRFWGQDILKHLQSILQRKVYPS